MDATEAAPGRMTVHAGWLNGVGSGRARGDAPGGGPDGEGSGAGPPGADAMGDAMEAGAAVEAADVRRFENRVVPFPSGGLLRERGVPEAGEPDADVPPSGSSEGGGRHGGDGAVDDRLAAAVGARMARARRAGGVTQARLAELVGVERPTVCRWERGLRSPSIHALLRVAAALGVPAAELLPETGGEDAAGA